MTSGALRVATTRWQRRDQGKVARRSWRRSDNRGDATTSWQTRGNWEGRRTRQTGGEASVDKRRQSAERTRGSGGRRHDVRRRDNQPEGPVEPPPPPPPPPPPRRDGGAPCEIPSDGGSSDVSCIVSEFGIEKIRASTIVVVDPFASPPSLPPSDAWRALLAAAAPAAKPLRLQR